MLIKDQEKKNLLTCCLLTTLALGFLLFFYSPLDVYIHNSSEFWFSTISVVLIAALIFIVYLAAFSYIGYFIIKECTVLGYVLCFIRFALFLAFFTQAVILASDSPALTGQSIFWSGCPESFRSILVFTCIPLALIPLLLLAYKKGKFTYSLSFCSSLLFLFLLLTLSIFFFSFEPSEKKNDEFVCLDTDEFTFSEDKNFIILVLDAVDADSFYECVSSNTDYSESFADFTFFTDALGAYPWTWLAIPQIFTGEWYTGETSIHEYMNKGFKESSLLDALNKENYSLSVYEQDLKFDASGYDGMFINQKFVSYSPSNLSLFAPIVLEMGAIKYLPWSLKWITVNLPDDCSSFKAQAVSEASGGTVFEWDNLRFYNGLCSESDYAVCADRLFKFIHLKGAHEPFHLDIDMVYKDTTSYQDEIESTVVTCQKFIAYLKNHNVYDNTAIVIMADHGRQTDDNLDLNQPEIRMHPVLLAKGFDVNHGSMRTNDFPFSYEHLHKAFLNLLSDQDAEESFTEDTVPPFRKCYLYNCFGERAINECLVYDSADNVDFFCETGNVVSGY